MLDFSPLTLNQIALARPYFAFARNRACDNTVGGTFMWRDFFATEYALYNDTLLIKVRYLDGRTAFSMPLGRDSAGSIMQIDAYCRRLGIPTVFCTATREDIALYQTLFHVTLTQETDWSDYLYRAQDLATFTGRRYNGQRNHANYFRRAWPNHAFEDMTASSAAQARDFFLASGLMDKKGSPIYVEERKKVLEVLERFDLYAMTGLLLRAQGRIVAFALGEVVGDTLHVHIEKADLAYRGAYPMIVSAFAARAMAGGARYINREEDVGDPGLRDAKLAYHPCQIIEKFTVEVS